MDKLREEFEAYWETQKHRFHKDRYDPFKDIAWEAWQASRAALVVAPPDLTDVQCEICAEEVDIRWRYTLSGEGISIKGDE